MKTKKIVKRLTLSKETVSNLNEGEMNRVLGGETVDELTCVSKCITDCILCPTNLTRCSVCCIL